MTLLRERKANPVCPSGYHRPLCLLLLLVTLWAGAADAATLYDRSLGQLQQRLPAFSPREFTFVVMGDSRGNDGVFKKALALAATFQPLFILHTGDFSDTGTRPEVEHFLSLVDGAVPGIPLFVVAGNHENRQQFQALVGPLRYTLDLPRLDMRLVVEDNSSYALKGEQLGYLRRKLDGKQRTTFVALHVPPRTERWSWHTFTEGAPELVVLLAERKVAMAFFGHIHQYDEDTVEGVRYVVTGGAGAPLVPFGFPGDPSHHIVVVQVREGKVTSRMVKIPR